MDMLAGLAKSSICRMPPGFCASAGPAAVAAISSPAAMKPRSLCFMLRLPSQELAELVSASRARGVFIEPDVFHPPAVVDAVDHDGQSFHIGLLAARANRIEQHRPDRGIRQFALDLPHDLFAFFRVDFRRLLVDQL